MKLLTIFTPTYNRAHTLGRLYDSLCRQTCMDFDWLVVDDGSTDGTRVLINRFIAEKRIPVRYIYKENGGLYTGYNVAYENIITELCACMDSDDFLPDNAVERIVAVWNEHRSPKYAGIIGLAYNYDGNFPIGGMFPEDLHECFFLDLYTHRIHRGDSMLVMRTELMRRVAPQKGFSGEKNFNPVYMLLQVCDEYPLLVVNENLCIKEYQKTDSMSAAIFQQYIDSPRSFAKTRILEMQLKHNTFMNKVRCAIHYVSSCILARDKNWLRQSPCKVLTLCAVLPGWMLSCYIRHKGC